MTQPARTGTTQEAFPRARWRIAKPALDPFAARPVAIMETERLAAFAKLLPYVASPDLLALLESPDTMWYDRTSIIPGYQDSWGDNLVAPVGMRPNTIGSNLIDLAVPGGHADIFQRRGDFHFPFSRDGRPDAALNTLVIDFWRLPRNPSGALTPVVHWHRKPTENMNRIEWVFPVDALSVAGNMVSGGVLVPYDPSVHAPNTYAKLPGVWKNYEY